MTAQGLQTITHQPPDLSQILSDGLNSRDTTVQSQANTLRNDTLDLQKSPNDQGLQSKVSTDFSALAEADNMSPDEINSVGEAASNLSPEQLSQLGSVGDISQLTSVENPQADLSSLGTLVQLANNG